METSYYITQENGFYVVKKKGCGFVLFRAGTFKECADYIRYNKE